MSEDFSCAKHQATQLTNLLCTRYYLTNAEIQVLETYADSIAQRIAPGSVVVELGSGYDSGSHCIREIGNEPCAS